MVSIPMFDLEEVGQIHELKLRECRWMVFCVAYQMMKEWQIYLQPFSTDPLT